MRFNELEIGDLVIYEKTPGVVIGKRREGISRSGPLHDFVYDVFLADHEKIYECRYWHLSLLQEVKKQVTL